METTNNNKKKLNELTIEELKEKAEFNSFIEDEDNQEAFDAIMQELAKSLTGQEYDDFCLTLTY